MKRLASLLVVLDTEKVSRPVCLTPEFAQQASATVKPSDGHHALTVQRDRHFGLNGLDTLIIVDGTPAASVKGGEAVTVYVPDALHIVGIQSSKKSAPDMSLAVDVGPGHEPILGASVSNWGGSGFKLDLLR